MNALYALQCIIVVLNEKFGQVKELNPRRHRHKSSFKNLFLVMVEFIWMIHKPFMSNSSLESKRSIVCIMHVVFGSIQSIVAIIKPSHTVHSHKYAVDK